MNAFESTAAHRPPLIADRFTQRDLTGLLDRYGYDQAVRDSIRRERLLPLGLLARIHATYPEQSGLRETRPFLFEGAPRYSGLKGFRTVVGILADNGVHIGHVDERELFIRVYRFMATRHVLNAIDWSNFERDSLFQLVFPQPGMLPADFVEQWRDAEGDDARGAVIADYMERTNPHDGNQLLNRPHYTAPGGVPAVLEGSQHKYPQCQLIFDEQTQGCFAFCTYCFRHAQVRGDDDMFCQSDVRAVHDYLRQHPEVTDVLVTGGDAGYIDEPRLRAYAEPLLEDPALLHVRTIRLGSRALTFAPERILSPDYEGMLSLFEELYDRGLQLVWMAHFSTPRELLNPSTIAAIRRLQRRGVTVRSQSPIMKHISLFLDDDGAVDIERSAQNWIDLGNLLATLHVGFHSMYCARPTGEHHYFTAPLADVDAIASRVYRSLASTKRPSRYISMTSSAGKVSILGTCEVDGRKAFALKFTEGRSMKWMDKVFLARWDAEENTVECLTPFDGDQFFYEEELAAIEAALRDRAAAEA